VEQDLYEFSTELDVDERRYGELAQMIRVNPPDPPNPRSILRRKMAAMQKWFAKKAPMQRAVQNLCYLLVAFRGRARLCDGQIIIDFH